MGGCASKSSGKKGKFDPTKLTEEDIETIIKCTNLKRPEIVGLHKNFIKECPSGKLNKKDFLKLFNEMHPLDKKKQKADKFCDYVFNVIDTKKTGTITFKDFVIAFSSFSTGEFKDKCEFAFKIFDIDKDGKISKPEMTKVLEALYQLSGVDAKGPNAPAKRVDEIMQKLNPDKKDQKFLSKEKFIEACKNDEALKKTFIDSVFNANEQPKVPASPAVAPAAQLNATVPVVAVPVTVELNQSTIEAAPAGENGPIEKIVKHTVVERNAPDLSTSDEIVQVVQYSSTKTTTIETTTKTIDGNGEVAITTERTTTSEVAH